MEHPQHQNRAAIVPILKGVRSTEHLENDLAILFAGCYRSPQLRVPTENVSPHDELAGDASGELYISRTTCEMPGPQSDCWGKLIGTGGAYKGRTGAYTFHNAPGSVGTGFWND